MKKYHLIAIILFYHTFLQGQVGFEDPGFGYNGILVTSLSPGNDYGLRLCVLDDDRFILAGSAVTNAGDRCFAMAKYSPGGELDPTFGIGGIMIDDLFSGDDVINSAIVREDGKILVAGRTEQTDFNIVFASYTDAGMVDSTFGDFGKVVIDFGFGNDRAVDIAVEDQNIFVGANVTANDSLLHFAVLKTDLNGNPDPFFGEDGIIVSETGTGSSFLTDMQIMDDGRILLLGYCEKEDSGNGDDLDILMVRYDNDGTLDESFGTGGVRQASCMDLQDKPYSVTIQSGNRIVVCGSGMTVSDSYITLLRFQYNGDADTTFGESGHVITSIGQYDYAEPSLVQPDNKIIVGGYTNDGSSNMFNVFVARYDSMGTLDPAFGTNGLTISSNGPNTNQYAFAMAFQSNYDILLAGCTKENGGGFYDFMTIRYIGDHILGLERLCDIDPMNLHIYPNPTADIAWLNFNLAESDVINIELVDLQGRIAKHLIKNQIFEKGKHFEQLNFSSLPAGNYLLFLRGKKYIGQCFLVKI